MNNEMCIRDRYDTGKRRDWGKIQAFHELSAFDRGCA